MEPVTTDGLRYISKEILELIERREEGVFVLIIRSSGSAPGKVGAKMVVLPDGNIRGTVGGGVLEARVIADALRAMEDGKGPRQIEYKLDELGMTCGGQVGLYLEPLESPKRIILFGGGHVASALSRVLETLDVSITVVDEREEWANRDRFPGADEIINRSFTQVLSEHPPGSKDHVIIVTRGHEHDYQVLEGCVERRPAYLGMIGSKRKAHKVLERLREKGVAEDLIRDIHTPIGLEIGAVTPAEIAVSIVAELIKIWRVPRGGELE